MQVIGLNMENTAFAQYMGVPTLTSIEAQYLTDFKYSSSMLTASQKQLLISKFQKLGFLDVLGKPLLPITSPLPEIIKMTKDVRILVWMLRFEKLSGTSFTRITEDWRPMIDYEEAGGFKARRILEGSDATASPQWMPTKIAQSYNENDWWLLGQPITAAGTYDIKLVSTTSRGVIWKIQRSVAPAAGCQLVTMFQVDFTTPDHPLLSNFYAKMLDIAIGPSMIKISMIVSNATIYPESIGSSNTRLVKVLLDAGYKCIDGLTF